MFRFKYASLISYFVLFFLVGYTEQACSQETIDIPGKALPRFHKVNAGLYRGGMPKDEGFEYLKKNGH